MPRNLMYLTEKLPSSTYEISTRETTIEGGTVRFPKRNKRNTADDVV